MQATVGRGDIIPTILNHYNKYMVYALMNLSTKQLHSAKSLQTKACLKRKTSQIPWNPVHSVWTLC
jgi:hypothetical protein